MRYERGKIKQLERNTAHFKGEFKKGHGWSLN